MIKNIGIDIIQNKRIKPSIILIKKILSLIELKQYLTFFNKKTKQQFLAGRWAVKEALIKALEIKLILNKITIYSKKNNKIYVKGIFLKKNEIINISLSHEKNYSIGFAIFSTF